VTARTRLTGLTPLTGSSRGEPLSESEASMARCERCGNDYDKSFTVRMNQSDHVFDSFECAIAVLAPTCAHCGCRIIGHGVESSDAIFCCAHCAHTEGVTGLQDRSQGASRPA
jgi:hypothetical protein